MRGAAHLSNLTDAIVIDIGGTTTDIGVLMKGFPRLASTRVKVGGVNTNFRMPDVISIALGGGSLVKYHDTGRVTVGPTGVGCNINQDALVFGGTVLTATDVAVAAGYTSNIGEVSRVEHLKPSDRDKAVQEIKRMVESVIDQVKVQAEDQPVILVGGGSILLDRDQPLKGASKIEFPDYFEVANAVGAALCKVSGMVDGVFEVDAEERDSALANVKQRARREAILNGADPDTIEVLEITATQLSYLKGNQTRICIKVVGDLADGHALTREAFDISKLDVSPLDGPSLAPTTEGRATCVGECLDPVIDANGDWLMQPYDVECVAIGAGILGCGGGGSPYIGKLKAINILKAGKTMRVIHPDRLGTTPDLQGDGAVIAFMGAPVILYEKLAANTETENAAGALKAFIANKDQAKVVEDKGVTIVFNAKELLNKTEKSSQFFSVALCAEVGGANSIEPLAFGALNGIPVVDADAMGRAFPKLQMTVPFVKGCKAYPAAVADEKGNVSVISQARNPQDVENVFREKCVEYGCASGVSFTFTCDEIKQHFVRYTISRARSLGDAVLRARRDKTCPLDCIVSREGGVVILRAGKIIRVDREISEGFSKGSMLLKGDAQESLQINFQNENYIVFSKENGANVVRACVPDLISVVNCDSGEPIATEEIRYGLRVAVLAMPCPPQWTTPEALSVVGPAAFGYEEIEFKSVGRYMEFPPIPKL
ncbi:uncharacterized protein LOC116614454 isoform X2 [Nematostella vectensis]|nr:uncharacterized protein LOC116614454 isoform X2 [Nematostella vectensis]